MAKQAMSDKRRELVARRFRTLRGPYRLRILQELETGEKSVGELVTALDGNRPNLSRGRGVTLRTLAIADEVDSRLSQSMRSYTVQSARDTLAK